MEEVDALPAVQPIPGDVTVLQVDQSETVDSVKLEKKDSSISSDSVDLPESDETCQSHSIRERTGTDESWDVVKDEEVGFKGVPPLTRLPNIPSALPSPSTWLQSFFDSSPNDER